VIGAETDACKTNQQPCRRKTGVRRLSRAFHYAMVAKNMCAGFGRACLDNVRMIETCNSCMQLRLNPTAGVTRLRSEDDVSRNEIVPTSE
jgi:hypothetical protein